MNIIIPLGGKGERFSKNGYTCPKPLIKIFEKTMIEYVLDNLVINHKEDKVFIIYNRNLDNRDFSEFIKNLYPFIELIIINDTSGAVETIFLGLTHILHNTHTKKCIILDCDTFYTEDIRNIFNECNTNMVFYRKDYETKPIYSYIELNTDSIITHIIEKQKISDNANTGAYAFADINELYNFCKYVLDNKITVNNEPYTSCVISEMIIQGSKFIGKELTQQSVISLGTPDDVKKYIDNTHAFLFDLDGTIVITDDIYFDVWSEISNKYNIVLTDELFKTYIQGNNDKYVLNTLFKNIDVELEYVSELKDNLFLENIHKIKVVDGIYNIIQQIKKTGNKVSIVTNCNKKVANEIVKYIKIDRLIDFIISNNDCLYGKPNSEPYANALKKYNITNDKCFIFEDSKTGLLSGIGINPKLLIGIETLYNNNELLSIGADLSIKNFCDLNINELIEFDIINNENYLKQLIKQNMILDTKDILVDETKLKGGFIADVIGFKLITTNRDYSLILKYENKHENNLSSMAKKLQLYDREYYFYTNISNTVNINIPKFYNLILDENDNQIGIVLENLLEKGFKVNLNLNIDSIDVTLKIVDRMSRLHSVFWNKNLKKLFPKLKTPTDPIFTPFFTNFIDERYEIFKKNWQKILNIKQTQKCDEIYKNFSKIQDTISNSHNLTFIHGDIKSPNIFYDVENGYEPWFIDWQHCGIGLGTQDLIFFIIESFDITNIKSIFNLTKEYYYKKLLEYGVKNYSYEQYEKDLYYSICYIPFFTSIWFGTTPQDELIDKNFPYFFINKLFYLIEYMETKQTN
jgi:HAD superfamily hydrolase (TIGR01509 family)